jgi:hypothetical protein
MTDTETALGVGSGAQQENLLHGLLGRDTQAEEAILAVYLGPVYAEAEDVSTTVDADSYGAGLELADEGQAIKVVVNAVGGPAQPEFVNVGVRSRKQKDPLLSELLGIACDIDSGLSVGSSRCEGNGKNKSYGSQFHRCSFCEELLAHR